MKRRDFIVLAAGALTMRPVAVRAQQGTKVPKVGFLYPGPQQAAASRLEAFVSGLRTAGYSAPAQVDLRVRVAEGDPKRIAPMAAEIVAQNPDAIFAAAVSVLRPIRSATRTIPIVALDLETDPVESGLVDSIQRPGGNITGVFFDFPDFTSKWLELLQETIPKLSRLAVLWVPDVDRTQMNAIEKAAGSLNIRIDVFAVQVRSDFDEGFASASRGSADAVVMLSSPLIGSNAAVLAELAIRYKLPAVTLFPDFARAGGCSLTEQICSTCIAKPGP